AKQFAGAVTKQSLDAAGKTLKRAGEMPAAVMRGARDAVKAVTESAATEPPRKRATKRASKSTRRADLRGCDGRHFPACPCGASRCADGLGGCARAVAHRCATARSLRADTG